MLLQTDPQGEPAAAWQNRVLEHLARRAALPVVFAELALAIEQRFPDGLVAILLVEGDRFHVAAAPHLAREHVQALERLRLDPPEGPCATAVREKRQVIVHDLLADPGWAAIQELSRRHGLRSWWSIPILAQDGTVRGTFALHSRRPRSPSPQDLQIVELASGMVRLALETNEGDAARRQAESRMASIVASALDAIVSMDQRGNVVEWNPSAERMFGYLRADAVGRPMADLIVPPALREAHWRGLSRYLATGEARVLGRKIEISALRADGSTFPIELAIVQLSTGGPPTFTAFIRDLTERVRQTEELRDRSERLRAIFEQVSVGVAQFDLDGRFLLVNDRYCQIVARSREELMRLGLDDVTAPEHLPKDRGLFEQVVTLGREALTESRFRRPDASEVWVRRSLSLVRDARGQPALVVGIVEEITQQKQAEAALQALNATLEARVGERTKALEKANRELESFSYILSHDLQAPLRTLDYLVKSSRKHAVEPVSGNLAKAQEAVTRMADLTQGMLVLARVSQGELRRERVDLSQLAADAVERLRTAEPARRVDVRIQERLGAVGDARLLASVLENLLGNAWKFTAVRAHATIEFGAQAVDGQPVYFVRDDGVGFDEEHAGKLFEPFSRLNPTEGPPGLGIGLATVRRIVERHGGRIWARGSPGGGATFYFTLAGPPQ